MVHSKELSPKKVIHLILNQFLVLLCMILPFAGYDNLLDTDSNREEKVVFSQPTFCYDLKEPTDREHK